MPESVSKPLILVVISILVVALIYSSVSASGVFAVPPADNFGGTCEESDDGLTVTCCWRERIPGSILGESYCQTCKKTVTGNGITIDCDPKEIQFREQPPTTGEIISPQGDGVLEEPPSPPRTPGQGGLPQGGVLEQPPTPPPSGPAAPLQGGVLEQLEPQTPPTFAPGASPGVLEQVPVCQEGLEFNEDLGFCVPTECPEGQVLDEQTGICVLEEPEVAEEEPEQQSEPEEPEQQQSSEGGEGDGSEDNSNDNDNDN